MSYSNRDVSLVLRNGKVASPTTPGGFAEAIAIRGDSIVAVGRNYEVDERVTSSTRVVDLRGRLVIPSFGDAHIHAVSGGMESLRCNLLGRRDRKSCLEYIAAHAASLPKNSWVLGGGWTPDMFPGGLPTSTELDSVCGGRPAFLQSASHHSAWASSAALIRAGITASTPDPLAGRIERDREGHPTGVLHESAMSIVADVLPPVSISDLTNGLRAAQEYLHSLGITYWQDALVGDAKDLGMVDSLGAYVTARNEGWLRSRVRGALWWDRSKGAEQLNDLLTRREMASGGEFRASSVKVMVDGATGTLSAAMTNPYLRGPSKFEGHRGELFIQPEELAEAVRILDAADFQVHLHTIGDRAISTSLDAIEDLGSKRWGKNRHHMAHVRFLNPHEYHRFKDLRVSVSFQPLWAHFDPLMESFIFPTLGELRAEWQYPIRSVLDHGHRVVFGSDWPVSNPDPLQGIHVAVNRVLSDKVGRPGTDETTRPLLPDQRIPVKAAVDAYTKNVAYINGDERILGTLQSRFRADMVVLNEDIFSLPTKEIGSAKVALTIARGSIVFGDE